MWLIPWIGLSFILYNLVVFLVPGADPLARELFSLQMISGAQWTVTLGDALVFLTLVMLFVELAKAGRSRGHSIADHALSTIVLILCAIEFLMVEAAATSVFFVITLAALIDVLAGFILTIRASRREFVLRGGPA